jgi:DDE superfamily endonuclease
MNKIDDTYVKNTTGFPSKIALVAFIAIVSDGNIETITKTITNMTWLEEWYVYYEFVWGRSERRWVDIERKYNKSERTLRRLFDYKRYLHRKCRESWPIYATIEEDMRLRQAKWTDRYGNERVVMWDNTNVPLYQPSSPDAQRNTYSPYYKANVGKGGVFVQLCGWMGTQELWVGAVSDTEYLLRSGILQQQQNFLTSQENLENNNVSWTIILDRGYRVSMQAWRAGRQSVLQPAFARSDRRFNTVETLRSAAIATDRGGNERAVRISKLCDYIARGVLINESAKRVCDIWLLWSFQANFMFDPVL